MREPVLDWLRGARHDASLDRDADDVEAGAAATPERRVATARGKLFGANPCHLLHREVAGNPMLEADMAQRARTVVSGLENSARRAAPPIYVECRGPGQGPRGPRDGPGVAGAALVRADAVGVRLALERERPIEPICFKFFASVL